LILFGLQSVGLQSASNKWQFMDELGSALPCSDIRTAAASLRLGEVIMFSWFSALKLRAKKRRNVAAARNHLRARFEQLEDRRMLASWSGTLAGDTVWTNTEVQRVTGNLTIPEGITLTIQPGTVVKFNDFASYKLTVDGTLLAQGTEGLPIVFTSLRDDTVGGDTLNDGQLSLYGGQWDTIQFNSTSTGNLLDHVEVRYGGQTSAGQVLVNGGPLSLTNSTLQNSATAGIRILNSNPTLTNVVYKNNVIAASMDLNSNPAITGVTMTANNVNALRVDGGTLTNGGTWNDPAITYLVQDTVTVPEGKSLSVAAGQVVKFREFAGIGLTVNGTLTATGTGAQPIAFTTTRDDTIGGDTYNDNQQSLYAGQWDAIQFTGTSTGNLLDHVEVRYGGQNSAGQVLVDGGPLTMTNSTLLSSFTAGIRIQNSNPTLTNTAFQTNAIAASMDLNSNPAITGVTMTNNFANALRVDGGTMTNGGAWNDPDITYLIQGSVTVPVGKTLSIAAGQVVKLREFAGIGIEVNGTLAASGSAASPVVFTTTRDDTIGGDTYNDNQQSLYAGQWDAIRITNTSTGNLLDHVEVRYGGQNSAGQLLVDGGPLSLTNSTLLSSFTSGIRIQNSNPTLTNVVYKNNVIAASMDLNSNPAISGVTMTANNTNALRVDGGTLVNGGIWNDRDITYLVQDTLTVPLGKTLSVAAGQIVKLREFAGVGLEVNGTLDANGTVDLPIYFTTTRDDTIGGDTYNDNQLSLYGGQWDTIRFNSSSTGNLLDHVEVRYGGQNAAGQVLVDGGPLSLTNSTLLSSATAGIRIHNSNPTLTNVVYKNNTIAASMDLNSNPATSGVTMTSNGVNALRVDGGTLTNGGTWDDPAITYLVQDAITLPADKTLTIAPGQIVKFREFAGSGLTLNGTLSAPGTTALPIIFTTTRDDTVGTDAYNDNQLSLYGGQWNSLTFGADSAGNVLNNIEVRYGGANSPGSIVFDGGTHAVTNSIVRHSATHGIAARTNTLLTSTNNILVNNADAAIRIESSSQLMAFNNTIDANFRGIAVDSASATVTNSLITHHGNAGVFVANGGTFIGAFNDVFNPARPNYQGTTDVNGVDGNVSIDPKYTSRTNLNYSLLSRSPVIDSGTSTGAPATDQLGNARFDDPGIANLGTGAITFVDLGALERQNVSDPINLAITVSSVSTNQVQIGDTLTLNWTVQNNQVVPAEGTWTDAVFASTDAVWDLDDTLIGTLDRTGGLAPGASYNGELSLTIPPKLAGPLFFIVRADSRKIVRESIESDNDVAISATLNVPVLTSGTPTTDQFTATGQSRYYRITPAVGNTLLISLESAATTGAIELYIRKDAIPTPSQFDARFIASDPTDPELTLPTTEPGTYYVLVLNASAPPASFEITAEVIPFSVRSISPQQVGNGGFATIRIRGAQFGPENFVTLRAPDGTSITPTTFHFQDAANLSAEFDLRGKPVGQYDVIVDNDAEIAIGTDLLQVTAAQPGAPVVQLAGPAALRRDRVVTYTATIRNTSNNDAVIPLLFFDSHGVANLGLSPDSLNSTKLNVVPRASSGPAGILHPGESLIVSIFARLLPNATSPVNITVGSLNASNTPVDRQFIDDLFPVSPEEMFGSRAGEFRAHLNAISGPTNADFIRTIHLGAGEIYSASLPGASLVAVEDVWRSQLMVINYIIENQLLDSYYQQEGITFGSNGEVFINPPMAGNLAAASFVVEYEGGPLLPSSQDGQLQAAASLVGTNITTTHVGNGTGKVRYVSAGFIASQNPYLPSDWVTQLADNLACVYPNDTIKVVNWNSGTMGGFGTHLAVGAGAYGAGGFAVGGPIGAGLGALGGAAIAGLNYYRNRANNTELVAQDVARDILDTTDPGNVVMYGHSLGAHMSGYTGRILNGRLGTIVGFDPAGEMFGGARDGLIPGAAQRTVGIFTSKSFGMLGSHHLYGRDPKTVTQEQYYPQHNRWLVNAHAESFVWYNRKLKSMCDLGITNEDPDLDAPTNEDGTSINDPETGGVGEAVTTDTQKGASSTLVQSIDPNDLLAPAGFGPQHWVPLVDPLPYTILFENDPAKGATAPAQEVIITNQLDSNLDWSTFQLGTLGFGSIVVPVPAGLRSYSTNVDTTNQDGTPLRVQIVADLNMATGLFTITFTSLDPATGQFPEDALAGFLPVNDASHRGEGFVSYVIFPKSTLTTGADVENQASIVFDTNDPLLTPNRLNTFDSNLPASSVIPLTPKQNTEFKVKWSGSENPGSGIGTYNVFVSKDNGAYELWQSQTAATSGIFTGAIPLSTYRFYAVSTDNVGHVEIIPTTFDTQTVISDNPWQNAQEVHDTDYDESIAASDVLAVINYINASGSGELPPARPAGKNFVDVNGDKEVAANDVIKIINFINANPDREGEAASHGEPTTSDSATDDLYSLLAYDLATTTKRRR
jgi:hypothetical protein